VQEYLKLAYDAGAQQALTDSGLTKEAVGIGPAMIVGTALAGPHADLAQARMIADPTGPLRGARRLGNVLERNIPRPAVDAMIARRNALFAAKATDTHSRVARRTLTGIAPILAATYGGGAVGGALAGPPGAFAGAVAGWLGLGVPAAVAARNRFVPEVKPTKMQFLKQYAKTPTGKAALLAALLGGGALGYSALKD